MVAAGFIFAALAALLHVYIFVMESFTWTSPRTRATFGTTAEEAETTKLLAFNQGFYNLFLAIVTVIGIIVVAMGHNAVGASLVFAGSGRWPSAAMVLVASSPDKARAALTQGTFPLIAVVLLAIGLGCHPPHSSPSSCRSVMYLMMIGFVTCGMSLSGPTFASCTAARNRSVGANDPWIGFSGRW